MNKRPISITVISWIFIVMGSVALLEAVRPLIGADASGRMVEFKKHGIVMVARILAIVSGVFMLYGFNWARWLLVVWMAFHIVLSALHSISQVLLHAIIFAVILYFLFRPQASAYFRRART